MKPHPATHFVTETHLPLALHAAALVVSALAVIGVFLQVFAAGALIL
ncbi:MAG: hypothetical protein ABUL55_01360 [Pseudomonadota bacterium]